jgi:ribA/ribD-fused uncharacterized protein
MSSEPIKFYTTKGEFGFMSNFFRAQINCFGRTWMTSEHAYQAQKFSGMNQEDYDAVHSCPNPMAAAIVGRDPNRACRPDWNAVRDDVMRFVVLQKFSQNPDIQKALLGTGDRSLFEFDCKRGDQYWAIDGNGVGKNMLGVILMEVREILREDILVEEERQNQMKECVGCFPNQIPCNRHENTSTRPSNIYLTSLHF